MSLIEKEKPIGICGFVKRDTLESADIGFGILPEFEGKGYTLEASKEMMEYGKSILKLNPILAITSVINFKSQGLLNKIGLYQKKKLKPDGSEIELLLFSDEIE